MTQCNTVLAKNILTMSETMFHPAITEFFYRLQISYFNFLAVSFSFNEYGSFKAQSIVIKSGKRFCLLFCELAYS